jgi:AraC family ethanolamine operon transcriptional activator
MSSSPTLSIVQGSDPEEMEGLLPGITRRLLPLTRDFKFYQAELHVGYLRLVVVKRPPCLSKSFLARPEIGIALPIGDSKGLRLDGLSLEQPALMIHGLAIPHRIFQPSDLTIGAIFLPEANGDRGWPERDRAARVDAVRSVSLEQVRSIIKDVMSLALRDPLYLSREKVWLGMQESLLGAIDHAFVTAPQERSVGLATRHHVRICCLADEFLLSNPSRWSGNADVAAAVGVTVRTLHSAMVAVNGISLQRFLTLHRLWAVRAALVRSKPGHLIKTIALDHGFWHFGRFSQMYRAFFGEAPSDTLARSS